jgi:hypothetical protein
VFAAVPFAGMEAGAELTGVYSQRVTAVNTGFLAGTESAPLALCMVIPARRDDGTGVKEYLTPARHLLLPALT